MTTDTTPVTPVAWRYRRSARPGQFGGAPGPWILTDDGEIMEGNGYEAERLYSAAEVERLTRERDEATGDRDALLAALGFKSGPLGVGPRRRTVLNDAAALRPALVAARHKQRNLEGDALLWQFSVASGDVGGLLLKVWRQRKAAEAEAAELRDRVAVLETALSAVRAEFKVEMLNGRIAGISHDSAGLHTVVRLLDEALGARALVEGGANG